MYNKLFMLQVLATKIAFEWVYKISKSGYLTETKYIYRNELTNREGNLVGGHFE